jgi:leucyl-tRNA synthetase
MVCHETYKDKNNNWLNPNEVETEDGKNFYLKENSKVKVKVGPPESMSKSKKNTIDPEEMIKNFGADSVRLFILSDSPPEKDVQWSEQGMISSFKFIQKLWDLHTNIKSKLQNSPNNNKDSSDKISKYTNLLINKINNNLEKFNYNVIVANMYKTYNFLKKEINQPLNNKSLLENYKKILSVFSPIIPHFTSECLTDLGKEPFQEWPLIDKKMLENKLIEYVVQFNGKKRATLIANKDISENEIIEKIKKNRNINKFFEKKEINKTFFVKNRLINFLIKQ